LAAAVAVPRAVPRAEIPEGPPPLAGPAAPVPELITVAWESETGGATVAAGFAAATAPVSPPPAVRRVSGAVFAPAKAAEPATRAPSESKAAPGGAGAADGYWVQVGAYRDAGMAKRVAQRLREQKYPVRESTVTRSPAERAPEPAAGGERDRYEVVVTGGSPSEVQAQLSAKGLTSRAEAQGAAVTPGLSLGEAVALSRDLSDSGLPVRVRRVSAGGAPVMPRAAGGGEAVVLYRVRVGGFADREAALAALKELEARGYKPFLARGNE
jgi:cell division septation protein DedD